MIKIKVALKKLFSDDLDIQQRLLNLILFVTILGGIPALLISELLGISIYGNLIIAILILIVCFTLWLANVKNKPNMAAIILVIMANVFLFPIMYFLEGGYASSMMLWMALGLVFDFLLLKGFVCYILYGLNAFIFVSCLFLELKYPQLVHLLSSREVIVCDIAQSLIIITCIFGAIFKYQSYAYEKQKISIMNQADELVHTLENLKKANMAKNEFLANMSHEIRTPINSIFGHNEMIMRESKENETIQYATNIQAASKMLLSIVNDILDYADIENGNVKLTTSEYSIQCLLNDIITYEKSNACKKNLEFRLAIDENLPQKLFGDSVRLAQIFDNLISNAIKYTQNGFVEVCIKWEKTDDKSGVMSVDVKDSGIGIKKEDIDKVSELFNRFDKSKNQHIQGIGLGLTIVCRLLELMGSSLNIESIYGKGSKFSFSIKQDIVDETPIGKINIGEKPNPLNRVANQTSLVAPNANILTVDDNDINLKLFKDILKNTRINIDTAQNGKECLKMMAQKDYDLIFLDHMMPVLDGIETLKEIRENEKWKSIPVIVLTANAVFGSKENYLKEGFDDYISKPIIGKELENMIKKYLPPNLIMSESEIEQTKESIVCNVNNATKDHDTLLEQLSFLDVSLGFSYCCNSEEFYKEMLISYIDSNKYDDITQFYKNYDWENYRIQVHALKSTSLLIGAVEISEKAKALEEAAKQNNLDYIFEYNDKMLEKYKELLENLKNVLTVPEVDKKNVTDDKSKIYHILVVDDDIMNLRIAEKILQKQFCISKVTSGKEALEFLEKEIPDLILLDIHMVNMSGFEVMEILKADERYNEIPVVLLTADNESETEIKGFRAGADDFISKPFVADVMLQRINRILQLNNLKKNLQSEVKRQTKEIEDRRIEVEKLSLQMVIALAGTIDAKDKYTNGHSIRVAKYSREIAFRLGLNEKDQENVYYAALLHDIGKIGIPDEIINKTSSLNNEEYALIKKHTTIGADILKNISLMPEIEIGAKWHHERYDGKGYPDGLKETEIPWVARIIGVADAYDAMTSNRSYRKAFPQNVIRAEIEKGKGTQFDPDIADIILEIIDEDKEYQLREFNNQILTIP